ncbi:alpha/beta hydrolase [Pseudobacteriovorax antillogorgiicola]|uniref:Lysophospholipase n=2 Tax=Pseudobacteriovorax antillogorgiicola TaxID=1513793 RepID=A0A1Y6CGW4_9BACT|nr:alpha/beta hydrolase [Pseudobacteriovorax antillogorgiicola]TCS47351.1 lysophospholipase [Pseudobacteriovorax antillogorgiicola]SMF63258.1 lysophospholipase [Pseudobacteriovorax antillogorgiicola]
MQEVITSCSFAPVFPYDPKQSRKSPQMPVSPEGFPDLPADWINEFEVFKGSDNKTQLFGNLFRPKKWRGDQAHKALVVLHGQGEHGGRYLHFPHYLKDQVSSVYALDHRGHGHSQGRRGHVDHFDQYAEDAELAINRFYEYLLERFGKAEIHLLGHSMGGQIAIRTMIKYADLPIASATVSSPMFDLAFEVPKIKEIAGRIMNRIAPAVSLPGEPLADLVSRDPRVCRHYRQDPLNHGFVSSAFYYSYLECRDDSYHKADTIHYPLMVQVAGEDKIIKPKSIESFYDRLKPGNMLHKYNDMYHEIYNEPDRDKAFAHLQQWISSHSKS